jgi:hypothetical protein
MELNRLMQIKTHLKFLARQPLRSLVLFALIGISVFLFVLRNGEFAVVRERIFEIGGFYRSIGFLQVAGVPSGDVRAGADFISGSEFIAFEDRRRGVEAVMHNTLNAHIQGFDLESASHTLELYNRQHQAFFYGIVNQARNIGGMAEIRLTVDEVIIAHPEHVVDGQELIWRLTPICLKLCMLKLSGRILAIEHFSFVAHQI